MLNSKIVAVNNQEKQTFINRYKYLAGYVVNELDFTPQEAYKLVSEPELYKDLPSILKQTIWEALYHLKAEQEDSKMFVGNALSKLNYKPKLAPINDSAIMEKYPQINSEISAQKILLASQTLPNSSSFYSKCGCLGSFLLAKKIPEANTNLRNYVYDKLLKLAKHPSSGTRYFAINNLGYFEDFNEKTFSYLLDLYKEEPNNYILSVIDKSLKSLYSYNNLIKAEHLLKIMDLVAYLHSVNKANYKMFECFDYKFSHIKDGKDFQTIISSLNDLLDNNANQYIKLFVMNVLEKLRLRSMPYLKNHLISEIYKKATATERSFLSDKYSSYLSVYADWSDPSIINILQDYILAEGTIFPINDYKLFLKKINLAPQDIQDMIRINLKKLLEKDLAETQIMFIKAITPKKEVVETFFDVFKAYALYLGIGMAVSLFIYIFSQHYKSESPKENCQADKEDSFYISNKATEMKVKQGKDLSEEMPSEQNPNSSKTWHQSPYNSELPVADSVKYSLAEASAVPFRTLRNMPRESWMASGAGTISISESLKNSYREKGHLGTFLVAKTFDSLTAFFVGSTSVLLSGEHEFDKYKSAGISLNANVNAGVKMPLARIAGGGVDLSSMRFYDHGTSLVSLKAGIDYSLEASGMDISIIFLKPFKGLLSYFSYLFKNLQLSEDFVNRNINIDFNDKNIKAPSSLLLFAPSLADKNASTEKKASELVKWSRSFIHFGSTDKSFAAYRKNAGDKKNYIQFLIEHPFGDCNVGNMFYEYWLRKNGIPAQMVGGIYVPLNTNTIEPENGHAVTEVFYDKTINVFDATPTDKASS